jgi:hypothetical protein
LERRCQEISSLGSTPSVDLPTGSLLGSPSFDSPLELLCLESSSASAVSSAVSQLSPDRDPAWSTASASAPVRLPSNSLGLPHPLGASSIDSVPSGWQGPQVTFRLPHRPFRFLLFPLDHLAMTSRSQSEPSGLLAPLFWFAFPWLLLRGPILQLTLRASSP